MSEAAAPIEFQYASPRHQAETAVAGMWLFLATEVLFFGGLIIGWIYARHWNRAGFDAGARETELWIGTLNTAVLVTSSFVYATGLAFIRAGSTRGLIRCCLGAIALGVLFLGLKFGLEYHDDLVNRVFPTFADFKIKGPEEGGARLFFVFYFISTALHGVHLTGGIGLVTWVVLRARHGEFTRQYYTPVQVVGLYWSFVDIVWLTLYPLIYLVGRS